ncbi:hypothetical protein S7711_09403 [Stachybotrys chartarum IBT 7711]|uniref:Uncharacterized protein n=1 Tax=Stachybotrys chartarum (strain CBS 109288 / IBT 7711) TaxID=1280523 RepID=A0A084AKR7_STACB|nr:hypothetical protein S7711_09403 [Stachybotrys chartarum IBT 7711]
MFPFAQSLRPSRRKLQKNAPKTKAPETKRAFRASTTIIPDKTANMTPLRDIVTADKAASPTAPDLSDAKWVQYIEKSDDPVKEVKEEEEAHAIREDLPETPKPIVNHPPSLIPEFAHLALKDSLPRPSVDSAVTVCPDSSSPASVTRRHAKTPVFMIGQLEKSVSLRSPESSTKAQSTAEQYRALLESRGSDDSDATYTTAPSPSAIAMPSPRTPVAVRPRDALRSSIEQDLHISRAAQHRVSPLRIGQDGPEAPSPTSDGTLVAFEEDTVYFKPFSISPAPTPPPHRQSFLDRWDRSVPTASQANLGLRISADLLMKELSSVFIDRNQQVGSEVAALQVWVMIEAYERLQDRLPDMGLSGIERENVQTAVGSWLTALYSLHSSLAVAPAPSESVYGADDNEYD